ncbi:hypothetical protein ABS735_04820 [Streptomyces sp. MMCC 100]|uniref:hypothetical protein n=1 Tax=Streptomyces sp. MMCC 100 TaxID=3163555 RepID=UPI003599CAD7
MDDESELERVRAAVVLYCAKLERMPAEARLRLAAGLREELDPLHAKALDGAMAEASGRGWALRRIGAAAGLSHEKVRYWLAGSAWRAS